MNLSNGSIPLHKLVAIHHPDSFAFQPQQECLKGKFIIHYESPERASHILKHLKTLDNITLLKAGTIPIDPLSVHSAKLVERFQSSSNLEDEVLYNIDTHDDICTDTYTPLNKTLLKTLDASLCITKESIDHYLAGESVYALLRPPGHHSSHSTHGGYCYYNYTALSAQALSKHGKVAVLDIDFHHGNGTQDIFYHRDDVLTVSIHADPKTHFPKSGFENEKGAARGLGFNENFVLPDQSSLYEYEKLLSEAIAKIEPFNPDHVIVAFGTDTYIDDPLGTFKLETDDYKKIAYAIIQSFKHILIIQEGGYHIDAMGVNVTSFLTGISL
jgi:acetoin utilization deacetylase AcuC-like enzyme